MAGGDGSQAIVASVASSPRPAPRESTSCRTRTTSRSISASTATTSSARSMPTARPWSTSSTWATVNDRVFVNNASLGAYAEGRPVHTPTATPSSARGQTWHRTCSRPTAVATCATGARTTRSTTTRPFTVSNNRYHLTSISGAGTLCLDAGSLGIVTVRVRGARDAAALTGLEATGRLAAYPLPRNGMRPRSASRPTSPCPSASTARRSCSILPCVSRCSPPPFACHSTHAQASSPARRAVRLSGASLARLWHLALGRDGP